MSVPADRIVPFNIEAEEAVLGSLLLDPQAIVRIAAFLKPDDFYRETNRWVFEAVLALYERRDAIDFLTVRDELERAGRLDDVGGASFLASLINVVPTAVHIEHYGRIVERASTRRRLITAASDIAKLAYDEQDEVEETLDKAEQIIFAVSQRSLARDLVPISQVLNQYFDKIEYLQAHHGQVSGTPTGFVDLDKLLGGLQKSDLVIVAARPGIGKTSLLLAFAHFAAISGKAIALFSLEMSAEQLVQRLISSETGIDQHRLRLGMIRDEEMPLVTRAMGVLEATRIYIDDTPGITALEMRTKARRLHAEHPIGLIVVDYLQLMHGGGRSENRVQEISHISRSLKELARELDVPVIAASQLSRAVESRHDRRPMLSDLRESGCLSGDTLIYLPDQGVYRPIEQLVGQSDFNVLALNSETWRLEPCRVSRAFATGTKPVRKLTTRLGRCVRATANHKFLTIEGWKRLDELNVGERLAVPRTVSTLAVEAGQRIGNAKAQRRKEEVLSGLPSASLRLCVSPLLALGAEPMSAEAASSPAQSDVYWDEIVSIEPAGECEVYDLTVDALHNFVANDIVAHNSIEQDADVVIFIYRDEYYNQNTEKKNIAEISIAKHRNGPTGMVELFFIKEQAKFVDLATVSDEFAPSGPW
ncbi:MAG: replicative DNA helicase [Anaerolineae bacterium]